MSVPGLKVLDSWVAEQLPTVARAIRSPPASWHTYAADAIVAEEQAIVASESRHFRHRPPLRLPAIPTEQQAVTLAAARRLGNRRSSKFRLDRCPY